MKKDRLILAAGGFAFVLVAFGFVLSRQIALEKEITALRAALAKRPASSWTEAAPRTANSALENSANRVGQPRPFHSGPPEERVAELERIADAHADLLDQLMTERARAADAARKASMRPWGPEQAEGAPDTMSAGDHRTAWAPASADGGIEWLEASFEEATDLARVVVRQTCNPGTITKVVAITESGAEVPIWSGEDPSRGKPMDDTSFMAPTGVLANRVRVYFDTAKIAGWEEVDAVQIVGRDGRGQWAREVNASSTYAGGRTLGRASGLEEGFLILQK